MGSHRIKWALGAFAWAAFVITGASGHVFAEEGAEESHDHGSHEHGDEAAAESSPTSQPAQVGALMNAKCPYTGKDTMSDKFVAYTDAKKGIYARVYFCCGNCVGNAESADAGELKGLYEKVFLAQADGSKLEYGKTSLAADNKSCPVSGDPVVAKYAMSYNAVKIGLCCAACEETFSEDPDKYLNNIKGDLDAAAAKAKAEG